MDYMRLQDTGGDLAAHITNVADADRDLPEDAKLLVQAALDSDADLAEALEGAYSAPEPREHSGNEEEEPAGAFVKAIHARGFRGIGQRAILELQAAPGLTIVAGRNGSGKSSFSEALEMALTGDTYRWNKQHTKQAAVWATNWRNLHDGEPCEIRVELAEEGQGTTTVGVDWAKSEGLRDYTTWVQRSGMPREKGISGLGWDRAVELHKPILSYDELGGLLEAGPSTLFDKLDALLGIEQATDAEQRLANAAKQLRQIESDAKAQLRELKKALAELDDERAVHAHKLLSKRHRDLDAIEEVTRGTSSGPEGELGSLKALSLHELPAEDVISAAVAELRAAIEAMLRLSTHSINLATYRTRLLHAALEFHNHRGDGPCPVCGQGTLDDEWRQQVEVAISSASDEVRQHAEAKHHLDEARQAVRNLVSSVKEPARPGRFELDSFAEAHHIWQRWARVPESDTELVQHVESVFADLHTAIGLLRDEAADVLAMQDDAWAPLASRLATWAGMARTARDKEPQVRVVDAAYQFMKHIVEDLRNQQIGSLKDTARKVWAALKQESNVGLGEIELKGSGTRRHVELHADVDGADAEALGVMSQGELQALALALFLPRATAANSPFRFVVLDDPVQAMDPAKIDGFARVLAEFARDRQVVVFSHDDRLPQTVRQLGLDARIAEVVRGENSAVTVVPCSNPARRAIDDARAVARDDKVPTDVKARVMGGLCRAAVEAAALDAYMTQRFRSGDARVEVEAAWQEAIKTSHKLALALRNDKTANLGPWLGVQRWRRRAYQAVTKAAHQPLRQDPLGAVDDIEQMVNDLEAMSR